MINLFFKSTKYFILHTISDELYLSPMSKPHIIQAHTYWKNHLQPGDLAIDMTCGNGHDTLFLADLGAQVFAFDIQEAAIAKTKQLVPSANTIHRSHDELNQVELPSAPKLIVYNLGYLPGGDKSIVTLTTSTIHSLKQATTLLAQNGAISIMCYPGHDEGLVEELEVISFCKSLPSKEWTICFHQWINRPKAPSLVWLQKI